MLSRKSREAEHPSTALGSGIYLEAALGLQTLWLVPGSALLLRNWVFSCVSWEHWTYCVPLLWQDHVWGCHHWLPQIRSSLPIGLGLHFSGPMHPMGSTALDQTQNSPQEARSLKGWMVWVDHLSYSLTQAATSLLCVVSSSPRGNRAPLKQAHPVWWVESGKLCGVCFANEKRFPVEARSGFSIEVWDLQPRNCS